MFIILLYIKSSQDLCANGFSLVVVALELQSFESAVAWWEILVCGCTESPGDAKGVISGFFCSTDSIHYLIN